MTDPVPPPEQTVPTTEAGRELLSRSRGAADAFTATLTKNGIDYYDVKNWAASLNEVIAIEAEARAAERRAVVERIKYRPLLGHAFGEFLRDNPRADVTTVNNAMVAIRDAILDAVATDSPGEDR